MAVDERKNIHPVYLEPIKLPGGIRLLLNTFQSINFYNDIIEFVKQIFPTFGNNCYIPKITKETVEKSTVIDDFKSDYDNIVTDGTGALGIHCSAVKKSTMLKASIKIIETSKDSFLGTIQKKYLQREREILSSVNCPYVPTILDYYSDENLSIIAEKFIDGLDLRDVIKKISISELEAVAIGCKITGILRYFYNDKLQIVNRDIKPANIMINRKGDLFIVDMSVAKIFDANEIKDEDPVGTPGYAAIEQFNGLTDLRTDIYGLGCTINAIAAGETMPIKVNELNIGDKLKNILNKMTEDDREKRYQTLPELKSDLTNYFITISEGQSVDDVLLNLGKKIFEESDNHNEYVPDNMMSFESYLNRNKYTIQENVFGEPGNLIDESEITAITLNTQITDSTCMILGNPPKQVLN